MKVAMYPAFIRCNNCTSKKLHGMQDLKNKKQKQPKQQGQYVTFGIAFCRVYTQNVANNKKHPVNSILMQ